MVKQYIQIKDCVISVEDALTDISSVLLKEALLFLRICWGLTQPIRFDTIQGHLDGNK